LVCLAVPAVSLAKVTVPPGSTEGDQYFEEAPNGGGSSSVDKSGGAGGGAGGASTGAPVAATQQLDRLGPAGKAAAALANANRPPEQLKAHPIPNPSAQSSDSSDGEGGLGIWFPLLLIASAFAALAYFLRRRLDPA